MFGIFYLLIYSCTERSNLSETEPSKLNEVIDSAVDNTPKNNIQLTDSNFILENELLNNWLKLGLMDDFVKQKIGAPTNDSIYFSEYAGVNFKKLLYDKEGLDLTFEESEKGYNLIEIELLNNSKYKTSFGLKIGSHINEVKQVYKKNFNQTESNKEVIVIGDVYYGLFFFYKNGIVDNIVVGSLAE